MRRNWILLVSFGVLLGEIAGCRRVSKMESINVAPVDSLDGKVAVAGSDLDHRLVLRSTRDVFLKASHDDSISLTNVAGAGVRVRGLLSSDRMNVASFRVMMIGDIPVTDGILMQSSGRLYIKSESGTQALGNPPSALARKIGARVWIGGSLENGPNTYGIIAEPPGVH